MLNCIDCKDSRDTCGPTMSSACVWYTGQFPKFINTDNLTCRVNVNDTFKLYGDQIDLLIANTDVKSLDPRCLGYDTSDITNVKLQDIQNRVICELRSSVNDLSNIVNSLNIGSELITIDLKCLKPAGTACEVSPNTYTLTSILNIIISKLCP